LIAKKSDKSRLYGTFSIEKSREKWYNILMKKVIETNEKSAEMITILRTEYEELKAQNAELNGQVKWLMEQMRLARQKRFGVSSEKSEYDQLNLFNEAEATADDKIAEPELTEVKSHYRKKAKENGDGLPADLPVEVVEHFLPEGKQLCPECGSQLHIMGKEVHETLKIIPAKAVIVQDVVYVYSCRQCEKDGTSVPVIKAPMPKPVIKGSFASPEAIAHIITQKFVMGIPLHRQEQEFKRNGILLSRQTMSNWLLKSTEDWLKPVYAKLHELLCRREVLHADETTLQVLHEPGKTAQSKSYMWLYRTGGDGKMPIVLYEYQPDRRGKRPKKFLTGFKGYLHTDGYAGYHSELSDDIVIVGCFAHARRKFDEALKGLAEKDRTGSLALTGKQYCDRLFRIERALENLLPENRLEERQKQAKPVLDAFLAWLKSANPAPKSGTGKAVTMRWNSGNTLSAIFLTVGLKSATTELNEALSPLSSTAKTSCLPTPSVVPGAAR
jgi:transposase